MSSFGYGQRQCLGMNVTQDEMFLACGYLLWSFNMKRKVDPKTGLEIEAPLDKSNSLLIIKPDPFQMAFEPRTEKRRQQIIDQWLEAEETEDARMAAFTADAHKAHAEKMAATA